MTLPNNLVPIAVSSGFDLEGKERIHAAPVQTEAREVFVLPKVLYVLMDSVSTLLKSSDGGLTWPTTVDTGGSASSLEALYLDGGGDRLTRDQPISGKTSTDGTTFTTITGALSGTGFPMWHMYTGSEWLRRSAGGMRASTDGVSYATRTIPALGIPDTSSSSFAKLGNTIIFHYKVSSTNYLCISQDNGATWSSFDFGQAITQLVATSDRFFAFTGASGAYYTSTTGGLGSWVAAPSIPSLPAAVRHAAYDHTNNVLVIVSAIGDVYRTADNGSTWQMITDSGPSQYVDYTANRNMIHAFGRFVLVYRNSSNMSVIITSEDGIVWTQRYTTSTFLGTITSFKEN